MKQVGVCLALAVVSWGAAAQQPAPEARAAEQFKAIAQACKAAYAKSPRILEGDNGIWVRHQYVTPTQKSDVRKGEAGGPAFVGAIETKYVLRPESASSEEAVTALPISDNVPSAVVVETARFAFQDGKWTGVGIDKVVRLRLKKGGPLEPARVTTHPKDELVRFATPAVDCLVAAD